MQQVGIYEQLITQLIESKIDRKRFYVGERELNNSEASIWLTRFYHIFWSMRLSQFLLAMIVFRSKLIYLTNYYFG